ncbi:hypothetical protein V7x_39010 [Crateriforma conspicua]|uniref:Uncharacterized protein n=2 Tax=Planctomycetaceae TaxID=126 RepID=A0A5C6FM15_9PLAN|nr:hypothetical protein V7x_39010 [Crateriforma conspicua]
MKWWCGMGDQWGKQMSVANKLVLITVVLSCSVASADLYTGHVASLEWKTHSADFVLLVTVESTSPDETTTKLVDVFTRDGSEVSDADSIAKSWKRPIRYVYQHDWKPDGEWLLFVRRWNTGEPTIDHTVFLHAPRLGSSFCAVTAKGEILEDRKRILDVVKNRLANGRRMTAAQRSARRMVDKGRLPVGHPSPSSGMPEDIAPWLGGFQIPADIWIWDDLNDERSFNESLWVDGITVPADKTYRKALFDYWINFIGEPDEEKRRVTPGYPLLALINYPGEPTERLLERIQTVHHLEFDVRSALQYLRFYESEVDPQDRRLMGSWVLNSARQQVQYDLLDHHELIVHRRPVPFPNPSKHEREWIAKGRWNLHHGRLRFLGTSLRVGSSGRFRKQSSPGLLYYHPRIKHLSKDTITFDDGVKLKRVDEPIEISKDQMSER